MLPSTAPRPVRFSTIWLLLRERGPFALLGLAFVLGPTLLLLPTLLVMQSSLRQPYERYDYEAISREGRATTARITAIAPVLNVSVNGEHPRLISYAYAGDAAGQTDQFQTFDTAQADQLHVGDAVSIRVLGGESVIPSLKPFAFPFGFFFFIPGVFLLIGLPFLLIGLVPALRKYRLYRYGERRTGTVQGITARPVRMSSYSVTPGFVVSYQYASRHLGRLLGEDRTGDMLLVQEQQLNDPVELLVLPTDETRSCLWPRLEALKNNWLS